jgi:hypothetical protein
MLRIINASGKIPSRCMPNPCTRVRGKPERMKLFFYFWMLSIYFFTIFVTISSFTIV